MTSIHTQIYTNKIQDNIHINTTIVVQYNAFNALKIATIKCIICSCLAALILYSHLHFGSS